MYLELVGLWELRLVGDGDRERCECLTLLFGESGEYDLSLRAMIEVESKDGSGGFSGPQKLSQGLHVVDPRADCIIINRSLRLRLALPWLQICWTLQH